jgi:hypothetical protein
LPAIQPKLAGQDGSQGSADPRNFAGAIDGIKFNDHHAKLLNILKKEAAI